MKDIDMWLYHIERLSNISDKNILEYLNDKIPSQYTDDPLFLATFGDYLKVNGVVITAQELKYRQWLKEKNNDNTRK